MAQHKRKLEDFGITRDWLEETPSRVLQLLLGIATRPNVRDLMAKRGYTGAEHERGWELLRNCGRTGSSGFTEGQIADAVAELDNWDEPNLRLIRAVLLRHGPIREQVLDGIEPTQGPDVILNIEKLLARLDALEKTPEGRAALDTLNDRGITKAERDRLAKLVTVATSVEPAQALPDSNAELDALLELRAWFEEWSEVARLTVTRRDHLIKMGLAERRTRGDEPQRVPVQPSPPGLPGPFVKEPSDT